MKQPSTNHLLFGLFLVLTALGLQNIRWIEFLNIIGLHALTSSSSFPVGLTFIIDILSVVAFIAGIIIGCYGFFKKGA